MRITSTLLLSALAGVALVTAPWMFIFHGALSDNSADWAAFGGYFGGVLSPLIAALALVALLRTINQQEGQIKLLREQNAKEDIWHIIEKIEHDFETTLRRYPINIHTASRSYQCSGFDIAFNIAAIEYKQAMVNEADFIKSMEGKDHIASVDDNLLAFEMFSSAAGELNQLRIYVEKYSEIAEHNAMTKYFQRKYKIPYARFVERGFLKEVWK